MSDVVQLACSVPQGSVPPALSCISLTAEPTDIAEDLGVNMHMYADDTQLYVHCSPKGTTAAVSQSQLELCLTRVDKWMAASRLKLNSEKSEVTWVYSKSTVMQHARPALQIDTALSALLTVCVFAVF